MLLKVFVMFTLFRGRTDPKFYTGEIGRALGKRIDEHKRDIRSVREDHEGHGLN